MKNWLIIGLLAAFSVGVQAAEPKLAKIVDLEKSAKAIRAGKLYVGKTYALPEENRFHNIHDVALGLNCNGCHDNSAGGGYPDNYLFLRRAEFPYVANKEDIGAVERPKCLACHSQGGIGTAFYNLK
jgi:hypothetical protein